MTNKLVAVLGVVVGGIASVLTLLTAFGVDITPDQHTAIQSVAGLVLLVVSAWFHPDIPVGPTGN